MVCLDATRNWPQPIYLKHIEIYRNLLQLIIIDLFQVPYRTREIIGLLHYGQERIHRN